MFTQENEKKYYFASYLLRLRPLISNVLPFWMDMFFGSIPARDWIEENASSSAGQNNISLSTFSSMPLPLPSLIEQNSIINRIRSEFEKCDLQMADNYHSIAKTEIQRKNIFKMAFSGKLVEQNPDDEPASTLLEKIEMEREARDKLPKLKKPKKIKEKENFMKTLAEVLKENGDWMDAQEVFRACGVGDGTNTDEIEELYAELRQLDKDGDLLTKRKGHYDMIKLKDI